MTNNRNFLQSIIEILNVDFRHQSKETSLVENDDGIWRDKYYPAASGSSVLLNPYLHPVLKEHEFSFLFARCKYCGVVNHSTDKYCFGCGAPL